MWWHVPFIEEALNICMFPLKNTMCRKFGRNEQTTVEAFFMLLSLLLGVTA